MAAQINVVTNFGDSSILGKIDAQHGMLTNKGPIVGISGVGLNILHVGSGLAAYGSTIDYDYKFFITTAATGGLTGTNFLPFTHNDALTEFPNGLVIPQHTGMYMMTGGGNVLSFGR